MQAYTAKREGKDVSHPILQPLFPQPSYTADQISKDQRISLENELRERGLLSNKYAIKVDNLVVLTNSMDQPRAKILFSKGSKE